MKSSEELREELNDTVGKMSTQHTMLEMTNYAIWGAVVTATRAFDVVSLKVDPATCRIFVSIKLRWWAKFKRGEVLRKIWLVRAEQRCKEHVPEGWRLLLYYDGGKG